MVRSLVASACLLVALAGPALAGNTCVQPYAPTVPNGASASKEEMLSAHDEVMAFIRASDNFQDCVILDIQTQRAARERDQKTLDPAIADEATARISANQREKERVGAEFNTAVQAYKAAHPTAPAH